MARIVSKREMTASHYEVWAAIADLGSHGTWMKDAESVEFVGERRRGEGTRLDVMTVVGPFRTRDRMEVTRWVEGRSIEVSHRGLVKGRGTLSVAGTGAGSVVTWEEDLRFPWWLGGALTAWLARPILSRIWRENLERLEQTLTDR